MADPNFSGINPDNLLRTIKDLESGSKALHGARTVYLSRFRALGLDTTHLTEIGRIAGWVDDELPILRRRQALAAAMEKGRGGFQGGSGAMVPVREPVSGIGEARAKGRALAEEIDEAAGLPPGAAGAEFHRIASVLAEHKGDPDFASAFYATIDPAVLKELPVTVAAAKAPTAEADAKLFGLAFTTAVDADPPAPGFTKAVALFHGEIGRGEPTAVFNRALLQGDDAELWAVAWRHTTIAVRKLGDPADTWSDTAGLLASVIGMQAKYAGHFWERSQSFSDEASRLYQRRVDSMSAEERRRFKKDTRRAARAARQSAREAERVLARFGMGSFSRLMEFSVADGGSWLIGRVPGLAPPNSATLFGRALHTGGKLPLVGTVLTVGAIGWDIGHGEEKDVAVAANVGGMAAGAGGTWLGVAGVALAGGPLGWGISAGVVIGFGTGYGISYIIKSEAGKRAVNAVTDTVKDGGRAVVAAASDVRKTVSGWFS
ncbi:hypothetical protein BU52_05970 [Streptomyces toyocaensis]|uniref:Uncharacterized protein n=1 Tax=Streptomyces toyocaensis TaxID=55952 RepID=A0A081XWQ0_STRTO|nr:hypothetical protein [Streptomyces toyocaensis]KES07973.1 hypothetical protein BU52_05970 [Streptomyces toyocaensis]